ncbi:pheromone A receptor-domain-containing protein [Scheffersomyces coipomensis]|uniref:pheromone A receptor-domain-containing protein n=1 Tax=Scheffersomyces coipomensis TaxID=1788519 RepID=UPI00315D1DBE
MLPVAAGVASLSFISFILLIPAFIWHCRSKNIPAICLIFWLQFINYNTFVNLLIWSGEDFYDKWNGKVYCDISTKFEAGSSTGKIAAVAALAMNLYMVLDAKHPIFLNPNSWKKKLIDLSICLITPIFIMATNFIIAGRRFIIVRFQGCTSAYVYSGATIALFSVWTIVWSFFALVFAILTIYKYFMIRKDVGDILRCTNSGLNLRRFARLLIFSVIIILGVTPLAIYYFVGDVSVFRGPFNWSAVHNELWGNIEYFDFGFFLLYENFINMGLSVITFLIFGLGSDAVDMYKSIFHTVTFHKFSKHRDMQDDLATQVGSLPSQSRINSNKSQFTTSTGMTGSTMNEFDRQYGDLLDDGYNLDSPGSTNSTPKYLINNSDLEKSSGASSPTVTGNSANQLPFINDDIAEMDEGFGYNFQVKQNQ